MSISTTPGTYSRSVDDTGGGRGITTTTYNVTSRSRDDNLITHSKKRKKPSGGWLYPTAYERRYVAYDAPRGDAAVKLRTYTYVGGKQVWYDRIERYTGIFDNVTTGGYALQFPESSYNLRTKAEHAALLELKDTRVNLGVAMAEAQKTADFVGDVATRLAQSFQYFRRKRFKESFDLLKKRVGKKEYRNIARTSRVVPTTVLEWNYAAAPLLSDVYGLVKELEARGKVSDWVVTAKGKAWEKVKTSELRNATDSAPIKRSERLYESHIGYYCRVDAHPSSDFLQVVARNGISNIGLVLWETVPYSFVFDWLVPVGEWLDTMDAHYGLDFLSGSLTELKRAQERWVAYQPPLPNNYQWVSYSLAGARRGVHVKRTIYSSWPRPLLPRVKNPLSLQHMANGLSLLHAAFYGGSIPKWVKN